MPLSRRSFLRVTGTAAALAGVPALAACGGAADAGAPPLTVVFAGVGPLPPPDPHHVGRPVDRARAAAVADTLLVWSPQMRAQPHLAESVEPDPTGTRWRVRMRAAPAHDGRPITAADALASLRRVADPATGATAAPLLAGVDLAASRAMSPTELEIVLGAPDFLFPLVLGAPGTGIVREGDGAAPIGTGAFRPHPGDAEVLLRHDGHWLGAAASPQVRFTVDDDEEHRYQALIEGRVGYAHDLFPHSVRRITARTGTRVLSAPGSATRFLEVGSGRSGPGRLELPAGGGPSGELFDDPRVCEAVRLGIDRESLVRRVLLDLATPGDDLFGPGLEHHPAGVPPVVRDVGRAAELLAAAGATGITAPLLFDPFDPLSRPAAAVIGEQLAEIGLFTEPREPDPPGAGPTPGIAFRRVAAQPIPLYLRAAARGGRSIPGPETGNDGDGETGPDGEPIGPPPAPRPSAPREDVARLLAEAGATPDETVRGDALRRAQVLLHEGATVWSDGAEHAGIAADLDGMEAARPDTARWARFDRARLG
ncbi:ABC transporter substrate-binding protein [Pseudonocardia sp. NPDC049635]|uniref:ABC transporter substrate-binding protein n=1 Tax=Pseudonocardia sp. NPDC049635 TaxID=3155506 RepID=UPI0033FDFAC6